MGGNLSNEGLIDIINWFLGHYRNSSSLLTKTHPSDYGTHYTLGYALVQAHIGVLRTVVMRTEVRRSLIGIEEAARSLGFGRTTLLKLTYSGEIPSIKIGSRRMYRPSEIEAWLDSVPTSYEIAEPDITELSEAEQRDAQDSALDANLRRLAMS